MIEGMLGDLAPEVETTEAAGWREGGVELYSWKEDNEGDGANGKNQIDDIPAKQKITIQDEEQTPTNVEESVPEGDRRKEKSQ